VLPLTPRLRKTTIAYGTCSFVEFAERSTKDARAVVREHLAALRSLRQSQGLTIVANMNEAGQPQKRGDALREEELPEKLLQGFPQAEDR